MNEMEDIDDLNPSDGAETLSGTGEGDEIRQLDGPAAPNNPADQAALLSGPEAGSGQEPGKAASQPGGFDAAIPWRGMPSLPSAQPLVAGVLQGARDADAAAPGFQPVQNFCEPSPEDGVPVAAGVVPQAEAEDYFADEEALLEQGPDMPGLPDSEVELVLGVKFSQYGPVYFFTAGQVQPKDAAPGKMVLVDTEQGVALAEVVTARRLRLPLPKIRTEEGLEVEIKPIRGLAGAADIAAAADNRILAAGARMFCKECIRERGLDMKLVEVEVLHDRSKIIFYFTAPTRIDFRELVKDLVRNYHTRIELRQIGVRHETQMIGALGNCGMTCCCRRYLRKFAPVTIKMAKEQNLFLNPAKLSGMCGRLLCCLAYEQENYDEFHKRSPKIGKKYKTDSGIVKVMRANLFRQSIFVLDEANQESEYQLEEWEALHPARYDQPPQTGSAAENERRPEPRQRRYEREERRPNLPEQGSSGGSASPAGEQATAPLEQAGALPASIAPTVSTVPFESADSSVPVEPAEDKATNPAPAGELEPGLNEAWPLEPPAGQATNHGEAGAALTGPDRRSDQPADKSIFGLPGSRFAGQDQPGEFTRGRPPGPKPGSPGGSEGGRRNGNHKHGNRHKPSKKGRNPGGGQG